MNNRIDKERIHLMSPCATVCAAAEIAPVVEESVLRAAIEKVLRALLLALNGETVPAQPVHLLSPDDLPAHPGLNPLLRLMMKRTNRRWQKTGRAFTADDFAAMQRAYAETHTRPQSARSRTVFSRPPRCRKTPPRPFSERRFRRTALPPRP